MGEPGGAKVPDQLPARLSEGAGDGSAGAGAGDGEGDDGLVFDEPHPATPTTRRQAPTKDEKTDRDRILSSPIPSAQLVLK